MHRAIARMNHAGACAVLRHVRALRPWFVFAFMTGCSAPAAVPVVPTIPPAPARRAPPVDPDLRWLADLPSRAMLDRGECRLPIAAPEPERHPDEAPIYDELQTLLAHAPRLYHFGGRHGDLCHLVCDGAHLLCGVSALDAFRAAWRSGIAEEPPLVVSRFTGRTIVGVFENYWHVHPDGSATHYFHARTDLAPSRCRTCGWNRERIARFVRDDGTPRLRTEDTSGN
mgnify:CR=1 FL=1